MTCYAKMMHWSEGSSLAMQRGGVEALRSWGSSNYPTQGDHGQHCRSLNTHGYTWYKGQYWQKQVVFPTQPVFTASPKPIQSSQPLEHIPKNRLIVYHWNGGALSSARYHELFLWLQHQRVDIAILSETDWSYTAECQTPHWHAIHSGRDPAQEDTASGILILVATKLCRSDQIVWREVEAGRLIHCRLHLQPRPFDIIGLYQYTWSTSTAQKSRRKRIWTSFRQLLKEVPNRHRMCVLGDFNCSLPSIPRLVGQAHVTTPAGTKLGPQHGDSAILSQLLNDFQVVALNAWTPSLGATSHTLSGSSRIDYILVRYRDADTSAKQVGLLTDAPYLHTGAFHIPMIASVNHKYFRQPRTSKLSFSRQVKELRITEFRQDTPYWQSCENGINYALRHAAELSNLDDIYQILSQGTLHYFQMRRQQGSIT